MGGGNHRELSRSGFMIVICRLSSVVLEGPLDHFQALFFPFSSLRSCYFSRFFFLSEITASSFVEAKMLLRWELALVLAPAHMPGML